MGLYVVYSAPMPTTSALAVIATGATIKTLLQLKLGGSTNQCGKVVEWGISFDGSAAATPIKCELLTTGTVGATVTEFVAADIICLDDANAAAVTDDFPLAFTASGDESGYNASAEGSITTTRVLDAQFVAPTNQYIKQFPLGREPEGKAADFLRIRVTAGTGVNAYCYVVFEI